MPTESGERRALFVLPSDRMGGAEQVVRTVAREAAKSGEFDHVEIVVLCWSRTGTLDDLDMLGNVTLHYKNANHILTSVLPCVRTLVRRNHYGLVFSSNMLINAVASLMRRIGMLRTERLVARESTVLFDRDFGLTAHALRPLYRLYGSQDLIVCQTERMRESLDRNTEGRLRHLLEVVPNPVDFDRIQGGLRAPAPAIVASIPSDRTKIVWCGRFVPVKAPLRAVETLHALHRMGRTAMHLVMIGDGPLRTEVENVAARLGLKDFITLVGHQSNPVSSMSQCEVGLLTSDVEGFPNVLLEMLGAGVRAVATTNCAGDLTAIPGVYVATDSNPRAIAETIREMLLSSRDPFINRQLSRQAPKAYLERLLALQKLPRECQAGFGLGSRR